MPHLVLGGGLPPSERLRIQHGGKAVRSERAERHAQGGQRCAGGKYPAALRIHATAPAVTSSDKNKLPAMKANIISAKVRHSALRRESR